MTLSSPTLGDLIDQVLAQLHGQTSDMEQLTSLTQDLTTSEVSFTVADATQVTRGLIEIDSELMWVRSVDQSNSTVTLDTFGRGFRETTAATHTSGAMVTNTPRFPRRAVTQAVQQTLYAVYPDLFDVKTDETITASPVQLAYEVAADCDAILDISWQDVGPSQSWIPVRRWKLDTNADTTAFASGKSVDIYDNVAPGSTVKITYMAQPTQLSAESDALSTTGLADSVADVLVFGACYRLLASTEVGRLQMQSIEQAQRAQLTQPGAATSASKYYFGLYSQALQREALRLQKFFPTRSHLVR